MCACLDFLTSDVLSTENRKQMIHNYIQRSYEEIKGHNFVHSMISLHHWR